MRTKLENIVGKENIKDDPESLNFVQDDEEYEELIIAVDRAFSFIERLNVSIET